MAGTFFEYFDGYVRCEFGAVGYGDVGVDFTFHGDTVVTTPHDDDFVAGQPRIDVHEDVSIHTWTSPTVSWFFEEMVRWLEAVVCGVRECAFEWDGEGPEGKLRWFRGVEESGRLKLSWTGNDESVAAEHEVRVNRAQMVRAFYESFRSYVESDRYDPIGYEKDLTAGEVFALVLKGGDLDALAEAFTVRAREDAQALFDALSERAFDYDAGYPRALPLSAFIERAKMPIARGSGDERQAFPGQWDDWDDAQRREDVADVFRSYVGWTGCGERLRELRSEMVEKWLASQLRVGRATLEAKP